jgi:hypothetical protein
MPSRQVLFGRKPIDLEWTIAYRIISRRKKTGYTRSGGDRGRRKEPDGGEGELSVLKSGSGSLLSGFHGMIPSESGKAGGARI